MVVVRRRGVEVFYSAMRSVRRGSEQSEATQVASAFSVLEPKVKGQSNEGCPVPDSPMLLDAETLSPHSDALPGAAASPQRPAPPAARRPLPYPLDHSLIAFQDCTGAVPCRAVGRSRPVHPTRIVCRRPSHLIISDAVSTTSITPPSLLTPPPSLALASRRHPS